MPRKVRVEYEGAIYHVMNRGDRRERLASRIKDSTRQFRKRPERQGKHRRFNRRHKLFGLLFSGGY